MKRENKKEVDQVLKDLEVLEINYAYIVKYMYCYEMREYLSKEEVEAAKAGGYTKKDIYFILNAGSNIYKENNSMSRHLTQYVPFALIKSMILIAKANIEKEIKEKEQLLETL